MLGAVGFLLLTVTLIIGGLGQHSHGPWQKETTGQVLKITISANKRCDVSVERGGNARFYVGGPVSSVLGLCVCALHSGFDLSDAPSLSKPRRLPWGVRFLQDVSRETFDGAMLS